MSERRTFESYCYCRTEDVLVRGCRGVRKDAYFVSKGISSGACELPRSWLEFCVLRGDETKRRSGSRKVSSLLAMVWKGVPVYSDCGRRERGATARRHYVRRLQIWLTELVCVKSRCLRDDSSNYSLFVNDTIACKRLSRNYSDVC